MVCQWIYGTDMRVTIYWKVDGYRTHNLIWCAGLPMNVSVNGEQYLDVTDEQMEHLKEFEASGWLEFRHKALKEVNGQLYPTGDEYLTNRCIKGTNQPTFNNIFYGKNKETERRPRTQRRASRTSR